MGYFTGLQGNVDKRCQIITVSETTWFLACEIESEVKYHDFLDVKYKVCDF